ncbi:MAG TPA: antibiotic biosynthesis monooxygenase [Deltaproteobacteria bacterium]|nr:antibiotic biosynthesis monooxygenase [Deltaproteobacteria bacterium]
MIVVHVFIRIKPGYVEAFKEASISNASSSIKEPGIARFDLIQQSDDPSRFVLTEIYRDKKAQARHKQTEHYSLWRERVENMMAEPRHSITYENVYPEDMHY